MPSRRRFPVRRSALVAALAAWLVASSGCGGSSAPSTSPSDTTGGSAGTPPTSGGGTAPPSTTITVTSSGVSPQVLSVAVGSRVTFTNADSRPHDFSGGPDPNQPECPEIDAAGFVAAGQSRQTGVFATARTCRYHDHAYLGVAAFTGRIVIE